MPRVKSESAPSYTVAPTSDDSTIAAALSILETRLRKPGVAIESPQNVKDYLTLQSASAEREEFRVLFLDAQHRVISFDCMFTGTLTQTSVYPREVMRRALALNAAAVILSHNHPSGMPEPSRADEHLTATLKTALAMVDIRILDHIIVGGMRTVSFAERGLL